MFKPLFPTRVVAWCCMLMVLLLAAGCATSPIVSAMTKVGTGQIDTLTAGEIQALADKFAPGSSLTAEQAQQFADFLAQSQVKTMADFMPLVKVVTGQIDTMTGEDILAVSEKFAPNVQLTSEQADAIAQFLVANQVKTMQDLQALINRAKADPTSVQLPAGFQALFEGFDTSTLPSSIPV